jgi:choline-sulfatase
MSGRPNILLVLTDQHNHRALGACGGPVDTPTLDRVFERGTAFERAYAPSPLSTPSRLGLLAGDRPRALGAWGEESHLRPGVETLPQHLSGYETALVGTLGACGHRQFAGFDHRPYGDFTGAGGHQFDPLTEPLARGSPAAASGSDVGGLYGHRYDPMDPDRRRPDPWRSLTADAGATSIPESRHQERTVVDESVAFLRETEAPWFLTASLSRPHYPLTAPERHAAANPPEAIPLPETPSEAAHDHPFVEAKRAADRTSQLRDRPTVDLDEETTRRSRAAYFACVAYVDELVGDLLGTLRRDGALERTVVVYASATGQLLGEHGLWWAGSYHEEATRVPLAVETPAHRQGAGGGSVTTPVSLADLSPTLCSLVGADTPDGAGADLSAAITGDGSVDRGPVVSDQLVPRHGEGSEFRVVWDGDDKHVRFRDLPDRAFDLGEDPRERTPLDGVSASAPGIDFAAVAAERGDDGPDDLAIGNGLTGNAFYLDDGRLVDADAELYKPDVLAGSASALLEDPE